MSFHMYIFLLKIFSCEWDYVMIDEKLLCSND